MSAQLDAFGKPAQVVETGGAPGGGEYFPGVAEVDSSMRPVVREFAGSVQGVASRDEITAEIARLTEERAALLVRARAGDAAVLEQIRSMTHRLRRLRDDLEIADLVANASAVDPVLRDRPELEAEAQRVVGLFRSLDESVAAAAVALLADVRSLAERMNAMLTEAREAEAAANRLAGRLSRGTQNAQFGAEWMPRSADAVTAVVAGAVGFLIRLTGVQSPERADAVLDVAGLVRKATNRSVADLTGRWTRRMGADLEVPE